MALSRAAIFLGLSEGYAFEVEEELAGAADRKGGKVGAYLAEYGTH